MTMQRLLHAVLTLTLLMTFSTLSAANEQERWPASVRIASPDLSAGSQPFAGQGQLSLAHINQSLTRALEAKGIQAEWSFFKGAGPAVNEAFANNRVDIAFLGDLAAIIGRAAGNQSRVLIGSRGSNTYLAVPSGTSFNGLNDLRGKRVGLFRGTADQLAFNRVLAEAGLQERDLRIINLDWNAGKAALAAGQLDALWQGPSLLALQRQGIADIPFSTKQVSLSTTTQAVVLGSQRFIDQYPELTQLIVDTLVQEAYQASQPENLASVLQAFSNQSSIPLPILETDYANTNPRFRFSPRLDTFLATSLRNSVQQAQALGLIRRDFDTATWLAPEFSEKAIHRLGYQDTWPDYDASGLAPAQ